MFSKRFLGSIAAAILVCLPSAGMAEDYDGNHFEFTMGFITGEQDYTGTHFQRDGDSTLTLADPFLEKPFNQVNVHGLRYEIRLVASYVRMTMGMDFPFTAYRLADATGSYQVEGRTIEVITDDLSPIDLHFGIGGEFWMGPLAAYADLIGGVHWTDASFLVDGENLDYSALTFNFWARAGLRVHVKDWLFLAAAGEIGIVGDLKWMAELSVGFAIM
jgi:hypothetical protein